ncbi:MAG TPA: serine acetyltransferase [Methylibium sp.]|nr:serine acetyltransferase [Methylibium sp.]
MNTHLEWTGMAIGLTPGVEDRLARTHPATQDERWFGRIRADFRAHGSRWGAQGFWALAVYRFGRWRYGIRAPLIRKPLSALYHVLFKLVQVATGIELPCEVRIGRNFVIDHFGGIIVSGYASFGDDCRIRQGVTVGLAGTDDPCAPTIGHGVDIGAGAKLLGRIVIGDHVSIGANAVVVTDVPSHCIAIGVPAVVRPRRVLRSARRISR